MKMFTKKLTAVWKTLSTVHWASEGTQQPLSQALGLVRRVHVLSCSIVGQMNSA